MTPNLSIAERRREKTALKPLRLARRFAVVLIAVLTVVSPHLTPMAQGDPAGNSSLWCSEAATLCVSLPDGVYVGKNGDLWLYEGWILSLTGLSWTFTLRVNQTSGFRSRCTHLIISLTDAGYNKLLDLAVDGTPIAKTNFKKGTPTYGEWTWPDDVYPAWFNDEYILGNIGGNEYKEVEVSANFSDTTDVRMHFDAYGKRWWGSVIWTPSSCDSTVLPAAEAEAPIASFVYSRFYPCVDEAVTFDASASTPNGGEIINYMWDFDDGSSSVNTTNPIISHTYTAAGTYNVELTVFDSEGLNSSTTRLITVVLTPVENVNPMSYTAHQLGEEFPIEVIIENVTDLHSFEFKLGYNTTLLDAISVAEGDFLSTGGETDITIVELNDAEGYVRFAVTLLGSSGVNGSGTLATVTFNVTYATVWPETVGCILGLYDTELNDSQNTPIPHEVVNGLYEFVPLASPHADFAFTPDCPVVGEEVTFNATDSCDPDGTITIYSWDFGDGNITAVNDHIITHIYTAANSTINYTVTLTVTDNDGFTNSATATVPVTNPAILHVSLPAGEDRTGISDPDPWLSECWLLNITGASGTFTVRIEDVSRCIWSYDTHLVIALNDAAYNNLVSLTVDSVIIVKNDFKNGTLRPYNLRNWPSGDVYPTWFNDTLVNVGTIRPKGYKNVTVSVTFSDATGVRMHFDAYGSKKPCPIPPTKKCYITHNPLSEDSTVLFSPPPVVKYYLTVISPYGTPGGEGWYDNCTTAYATLNTGIVDHGNGTRRVFTHWSGDASGNTTTSDPIHMDQNKTAIANWKTQYYMTLTTNPPSVTTPSGEGWYDADTYAPINTSEFVDSRYRFTGWTTSNMSEITDPTSPSTTVLMDEAKTVTANYIIRYNVTFSQTGLSSDATGTVVTVNGTPKTFGDLPLSMWVDNGSVVTYSYEVTVSSSVSGKRFRLDTVTGPGSPITVTSDTTVTGNYVTQYLVTLAETGLDATATGTVVTVDGNAKTFSDLPFTLWVDSGDSVSYAYSNLVSSTEAGKRFSLVNVTGPGSPITVTSSVTVTGNYKIQYQVTFDQSGVGTDFTGTVVTVDSTTYKVADLPVSVWWDESSQHNFSFASPLIVNVTHQYFWASTSGLSTLQSDTLTITSSGSITGNYVSQVQYQITFDQTGVDTDFTGTVVVIDGANYGVGDLPVSFWWNASSVHNFTFQSPLVVSVNAKQYVWSSTSGLSSLQSGSIIVSASGSIIGNYKTQYYLTMSTNFGTVAPGSGWHDAGSTVQISASAPGVGAGERYVWLGWTGSGNGSYTSMDNPASITMNSPITETATWRHEYRLTMDTNFGTTSPSVGDHWYEAGSTVQITATAPSAASGEQYVWLGWTGTGSGSYSSTDNPASVTMNGPISETAAWRHDYYLTVDSPYDSPTPLSGWFEAGESVTASVTSPVSGPAGTRYVCTGWTGTGSVPSSGTATTVTFTINEPSSITWTWKTQYYLTVRTDPAGLSPAPTPPSKWYDESTDVDLTAPDPSYLDTDEYNFTHWDVDGTTVSGNPITVHMDMPHTATAHYEGPPSPPPKCVGGEMILVKVDKPVAQPPIDLACLLLAVVGLAVVLMSQWKKRRQ